MRINPGFAIGFLVVSIAAGVGLGSFIKSTPSVLIVHCPDGFKIEIHGQFDLKTGHRMRLVFCEQEEYKDDNAEVSSNG